MSSLRPDVAARIGPWLTIATVVVGAAFWFASLEEAKNTGVQNDARQDASIGRCDDRVRALENNRELEREVAELRKEVATLIAQVSDLRDEIKRKRR